MKRFALGLLLACCAITVVAIGFVAGVERFHKPVANVACITSGNEPYHASLLIVGESWAAPDHIFPSLPAAFVAKLDGAPVKVCSIAFNGETSENIYRGLKAEIAHSTIIRAFHGQAPDTVIVLNGVNDEIRHAGAVTYAQNTAKIVSLFPGSVVQVVTAPATHFNYEHLSWLLQGLARARQYLYDDGTLDPAVQYRSALTAAYPEIKVIRFEEFMPTYDRSRYTADGIHLTPDEFRRYSTFLAEHVLTRDQNVLRSRQHQ